MSAQAYPSSPREYAVHSWPGTAPLDCPYQSAWARLGFGSCAEAQAEMEQLKVENRDLRRVFEQATIAFQEKEAEIRRLKEEAEVLRRKLRDQLQQPFTKDTQQQEPAANQEQESPDQPEQKRKKHGAPKGHRGATRKPPNRAPDRTIPVNPYQCPECHSGNISACQETEEHTQLVLRSEATSQSSRRPRYYPAANHPLREKTRILPRLRRVIFPKRRRRTTEWVYRPRGRGCGRLPPLCRQNAL